MIARAALVGACGLAACGQADPPTPTSGPIERIVHIGPTGVQLYAFHHRLELAELPIDDPLGLPLAGPIELDANLWIPLSGLQPDLRRAHGRAAVRCVGQCRLGDDHAALRPGGDPPLGDVALPRLDLDGLDVQVEVAGGTARLRRFALASADVELTVELEVRIARAPEASALDGCVRVRPTAALGARAPGLLDLLASTGAGTADGWYQLVIAGTVGAPRVRAAACAPATAG